MFVRSGECADRKRQPRKGSAAEAVYRHGAFRIHLALLVKKPKRESLWTITSVSVTRTPGDEVERAKTALQLILSPGVLF